MSKIPREETFRITKAMRHDGTAITEDVRESQLTKGQIDMMYSDLLSKFNSSPKKVKRMFVNKLTSNIVKTQQGRMIKTLENKIIEHGKRPEAKESHKDSSEQKKEA